MEILYAIASIRNPVCDFIFETITHLGEETFFLVISIIFFWCINKREGYYILLSGLFGTLSEKRGCCIKMQKAFSSSPKAY